MAWRQWHATQSRWYRGDKARVWESASKRCLYLPGADYIAPRKNARWYVIVIAWRLDRSPRSPWRGPPRNGSLPVSLRGRGSATRGARPHVAHKLAALIVAHVAESNRMALTRGSGRVAIVSWCKSNTEPAGENPLTSGRASFRRINIVTLLVKG